MQVEAYMHVPLTGMCMLALLQASRLSVACCARSLGPWDTTQLVVYRSTISPAQPDSSALGTTMCTCFVCCVVGYTGIPCEVKKFSKKSGEMPGTPRGGRVLFRCATSKGLPAVLTVTGGAKQ